MSFPRRHFLLLSLALLAGANTAAAQSDVSPWVKGLHTQARLIAGSPKQDGQWRAGVEIKLDPGFKTYWRNPGNSGVPPSFDFTGSDNLKSAEALFPAPTGFSDGVGLSIGYDQDVVLPLRIEPRDPAKPINLTLKFDYAVCEKLCIPAQAMMRLSLSGAKLSRSGDALLAAFEARVPQKLPLGKAGAPLAVLRNERLEAGKWRVVAHAPAGQPVQLYAEGPQGWYFDVSSAAGQDGDKNAAQRSFILSLAEKPAQAEMKSVPLRLTLVTPENAVETELPLDVAPLAP